MVNSLKLQQMEIFNNMKAQGNGQIGHPVRDPSSLLKSSVPQLGEDATQRDPSFMVGLARSVRKHTPKQEENNLYKKV